MKLLSLSLEGFLSYRQRQTIPLADQGVVVIRGNNGAGKTALWHALSYVCFGKTLDGRVGDDLCWNGTAETSLIVDLETDAGRIRRGRRPNIAPDQAEIADKLGFGYETLKNAVIFAQQSLDRFIIAEQSEQLRMLDEIQGVDFRRPLDRAKIWRDGIEEELGQVRHAGNAARIRADLLGQQVFMLNTSRDRFADAKKTALATIDVRKKTLSARLKELTNEGAVLEKKRARLAQAVLARETWERSDGEYKEAALAVIRAEGATGSARGERDRLMASVKALIESKRCPTCRQATSNKITTGFDKDIADAEQRVAKAERAEVLARRKQKECLAARNAAFKNIPEDFVELNASASDPIIARINEELRRVMADIKATQASEAEERARVWKDVDLLEKTARELAQAQKEHEDSLTRATTLTRTLAVAEYWVEAFGDRGIRSLMLDSTLPYIEKKTREHLAVLANGDANVTLSAQKELKSGKLKERFTVLPVWRGAGRSVKELSTGQRRCVDLALFAALQDISEERSARPFPLKVFDEPADALDPEHIELFAVWLRQQARERGTAFLVTHNALLAEQVEADQIWTIQRREREGSWINFNSSASSIL